MTAFIGQAEIGHTWCMVLSTQGPTIKAAAGETIKLSRRICWRFSGQRQFENDAIGFRTMTSLEPLMGSNGYPELLQTGETGNGITPLLDRQHPHDLFMELALTENHQLSDNSSVFLYGGLPGEPALGPTAFMHRLSGEDNPMAPISHHWMDSTHTSYGVLTTGYIWESFKLEGSSFRGREPDQNHWNIETPKLDSYSGRLSYNPTENWSAQVSMGHLTSPEQLFPATTRTGPQAASAIHARGRMVGVRRLWCGDAIGRRESTRWTPP